MNKFIILSTLLVLSTSLFANKTIYQESYTDKTCLLIHTDRQDIQIFDLYSEKGIFGGYKQARGVIKGEKISLEGKNFENLCSSQVSVEETDEAIIFSCENTQEGQLFIMKDESGKLESATLRSNEFNISCIFATED